MSLGPGALISLAQAKQQLNMSSSAHDGELEDYITAASEAVEDYLGYVAVRRTAVEDRSVDASGIVCLRSSPIVSLVSVVALADDSDVTGSATVTDHQNGIIALPAAGTHRFTLVAGPSVTPPKVQLATRIILADLWSSQRLSAGDIDDPMGAVRPHGYLIPYQAAEMLGGRGSNAP
jgi:hypothetical protein